ncbi:zinc finger protein 174-like [Sycon ciliatum]|uniref:zinc finger protein 174-like n=1 Tax=Sycon ciliatum TaxID=27933 RepID=UPI0031F628DB
MCSNVNTRLVHHDAFPPLGDSKLMAAPAPAIALQPRRQHLQPPNIAGLLDLPQSPHDFNQSLPQSNVFGKQPSMKEPENPAKTFSFHQGKTAPILPDSLMPDNQHTSNSLSDAALFPFPPQVSIGVSSFGNIGFPHDVFAPTGDTNAMVVSRQGRQHIPSLPEMPPSRRHDLSEPLSQSTLLGQQPSMQEPDNTATPFSLNPGQAEPLLQPNLPNSLSDAAIFPYLPKVSTAMRSDVNTGLNHDVFAPSCGIDVLLSPSLARGLQQQQRQQQHHKPPHIPRLQVMPPHHHDLSEPLPPSNVLGQQPSTNEPEKSAKAKIVCPECKRSFSYPSQLKRHMTVHTGEKPYHCDRCNSRFSLLTTLTKHKRTHTGEKPYKCTIPGCEQAFSQSSTRNRHVRIHKANIEKQTKPASGCN